MSSTPKPNPNVPQIPQPQADVGALAFVVQALKQGVDSLAGNRGDPRARAVTFNDLDALELFGAPALNSGADIQGTIAATTTATAVSPTGIQSALINMGSVATTIDVNSGYVGQHLRLEIKQGATQHAATLGTTVVYGTDIASFTSTPTAGARDVLELINLNGSRWAPAWVSRGFTV